MTLTVRLSPAAWTRHAACRGEDPDLFFPDPTQTDRANRAVAICTSCPVHQDCLDEVLHIEGNSSLWHRHGIRGGLTPRERRDLALAPTAHTSTEVA